jgi:tRNA(adenine34) deaminase
MYESLSKPRQACVDLAWEAYCAGSLPIAAVITDEHGNIAATGRNRLFEKEKIEPYISNTSLAHAEINAILALDKTIKTNQCTLYTTTEPCPLCMGALRMAGFTKAVYACRDPWAGCSHMVETVPYLKNKNMRVDYLGNQAFEHILAAWLLESDYLQSLEGRFFEAWLEMIPEAAETARALAASGALKKLRQEKTTAREMLEAIAILLNAVKSAKTEISNPDSLRS